MSQVNEPRACRLCGQLIREYRDLKTGKRVALHEGCLTHATFVDEHGKEWCRPTGEILWQAGQDIANLEALQPLLLSIVSIRADHAGICPSLPKPAK